jgi:signal transduction histidine kinase
MRTAWAGGTVARVGRQSTAREPWSGKASTLVGIGGVVAARSIGGVGTMATRYRSEYSWLLPAVLTEAPDRPSRRSTRDWIIDSLCFVIGFGFTVFITAGLVHGTGLDTGWQNTPAWLIWVDFATGTLAAASLWWRRRWPVQLVLATMPIGLFSVASAMSLLILFFTIAVHRRFAVVAAVAVLSLPVNAAFTAIRPERGTGFWESMAWSVAILAIIMLWGMVVRARRQLVVSLRDRAERAESEQQLRVTQARALERTRIAREMHDVLAHRISLLSLHAGALEIRPDAAPAEVAVAAGVIRASAHQALQDLREVIGVLREPSDDPTPERPQPTLGELPALVDESRAAGTRVTLDVHVTVPAEVPAGTGRTAYRIVQEGLTNARKHAPGAAVRVEVAGAAGAGLTLKVRNRWPIAGGTALPGTGIGLVGLAERATLAGGTLTHGRTSEGDFALTAWLPWPA